MSSTNRITGRASRRAPGGDGADFTPLPRRPNGAEEFRGIEQRLRQEAEAVGIGMDVRQVARSSPDLLRVEFTDLATGGVLATYSPATGALTTPGGGPISLNASPAEALALAVSRKGKAEDLQQVKARLRQQAAAAGVDLGDEGPVVSPPPPPPTTNGTCGGGDGPERGDGRRPDGKFAKGNKGGPGNPLGRQVAQLRAALVGAVSAEDVRQIARRLVRAAKAGNVRAAELVLQYVCGRPAAVVEGE